MWRKQRSECGVNKCGEAFRISDRVESRRARLSATTPSCRHIWSSTHTKRPSLDHTRNCQPSPNQLSNFNFLRGHRLPPNRCHRFRHPRAQTTPHHSIIHTPKMIVYLAPNIFQFSKGSPTPTHRLRTPTTPTITHLHNTPRTLRRPSHITALHLALFADNHPYPQYTSHCSPTITHTHNTPRTVRRPIPHLG